MGFLRTLRKDLRHFSKWLFGTNRNSFAPSQAEKTECDPSGLGEHEPADGTIEKPV